MMTWIVGHRVLVVSLFTGVVTLLVIVSATVTLSASGRLVVVW